MRSYSALLFACCFCFFFQAEDGIRDKLVTGVQTCALPISVIGPLADDKDDPLGPWRGNGKPENTVTVLEGIREKAPPGTRVTFAKGCGIDTLSTRLLEEALGAAMEAAVSIAVLGESAEMRGEASSGSSIG